MIHYHDHYLQCLKNNVTHRMPADPRLGQKAIHEPRISLSDYLSSNAEPPARLHRGLWKGYGDVLGNDTLGDCAEAMTIHGIEAMQHAAKMPISNFQRDDAVLLYEQAAGYDPDDPSTDQGTDNSTLVSDWTGFGVLCETDNELHTIAGTVWVDPSEEVQNKIAIYEFGVLFRAVNLPLSAQGKYKWQVVGDGKSGDSAPGSWGGHDVPYHAYDETSYDANSWGIWIPVDDEFDLTYGMQGFVVVTKDQLNKKGVSATGLDWSRLTRDLKAL